MKTTNKFLVFVLFLSTINFFAQNNDVSIDDNGVMRWGKTNKEVARELNITEATVKVHVKNLLKKLSLKSRVEAALWAVSNKIVSIEQK